MGRSSNSKRSNGPATARNDAGLVGPGKRLQKAKSNGTLNGVAASSTTAPPLPIATASSYPHATGRAAQTQGGKGCVAGSEQKLQAPPGVLRRGSVGGYSESSSGESYQLATNMMVPPETHRRIDVNAAKNPAVHRDLGGLGFLVTVLRSCPLYDTIAILIVLLQIPPMFLTIIHLLFVGMTFVPTNSNANSSFSLTDIFEGAMGTPSTATLVAVDILVLMVWLFLWSPLQDLSLDLAQVVISLTLGGGVSGKDGGLNSLIVCLGIVGASHYIKNSNGHAHSKLQWLFQGHNHDTSERKDSGKGAFVWIRTIVAVHILTQGIVRYIRDWYLRREKKEKVDPETGSPTIMVDGSHLTATVTTPDLENADKSLLNPKLKKKANAQVRIRQPLWSALARTKIVMAKEYETTRHAAESAGTNATDVNNLGNAPFSGEADRIWITFVGEDEVCFSTSSFTTIISENRQVMEGADLTKPFFVRVNKTIWQPTRITPIDDLDDKDEVRWSGEIFGLAPFSNYECEFVSTLTGETIFSTSVRTLAAPIDTTSLTTLPALTTSLPRNTTRPNSPTTTLRTSILTAEAKLSEERAKQKRDRKDAKTRLHAVRKEIERLSNSLANSGGNDEKLRMKVVQSQLHAKQAEEAFETMAAELDRLQSVPDEVEREFRCAKLSWTNEKETHKSSRTAFHGVKAAAEKQLQALTAELGSLQQKHERMQSRIARLNGEAERLADANAKGLDEAQRRAREQDAKDADHARSEMLYLERIDSLSPIIANTQNALAQLWSSISALQAQEMQMQQVQAQAYANSMIAPQPSPTAFDAAYPWGTNTGAYSAYTTSAYAHPAPSMTISATETPARRGPRGRSSSMLSGVSGFTISDDESGPATRPKTAVGTEREQRKEPSEGSGSGSGGTGSGGSGMGSGSAGNGSPVEVPASRVGTGAFRLRPPPGLGGVAVWRNPWDP